MWRSAGPDRRSRNDSLFYLLTTGCQPFSPPQVNSRAMMCPAMQTVRNGERHRPQDMEKGHLSRPKDDPDLRKPSRDGGILTRDPLTPSHEYAVAGCRRPWPGEPLSCANVGRMLPGVVCLLSLLAPPSPFGSRKSMKFRSKNRAVNFQPEDPRGRADAAVLVTAALERLCLPRLPGDRAGTRPASGQAGLVVGDSAPQWLLHGVTVSAMAYPLSAAQTHLGELVAEARHRPPSDHHQRGRQTRRRADRHR